MSTATSTLGDPDFVDNPLDRLLDKAYAASDPRQDRSRAAPASRRIWRPARAPHEGTETTHYSIVDDAGNAVAVTYTINGYFGASVMAGDTGFLLNDEMDDFTTKPGVPNLYRPGAGQGQRHRAEQAAAQLDEPDHRRQGRQAVHGDRQPGRLAHHHHHARGDHERHRPRHDDRRRRSTRRASTINGCPDKVYVEPFALSPDTERLLAGMGYGFTEQQNTWGSAARHPGRRPAARGRRLGAQQAGGRRPLLRRQRQPRAGGGRHRLLSREAAARALPRRA